MPVLLVSQLPAILPPLIPMLNLKRMKQSAGLNSSIVMVNGLIHKNNLNTGDITAILYGQTETPLFSRYCYRNITQVYFLIELQKGTRPSKQCKSLIDVLMLRQYLEK